MTYFLFYDHDARQSECAHPKHAKSLPQAMRSSGYPPYYEPSWSAVIGRYSKASIGARLAPLLFCFVVFVCLFLETVKIVLPSLDNAGRNRATNSK